MNSTTLARLICDEATAKRVANALSEQFEAETAVAAFEGLDGRWNVEVHFEHPPDLESLRDMVRQAAGMDLAVTLDTIEAKDWVAASLADLKPVAAGRFMVHGAHDRGRVAPNRLGIEIEAALAFGTGHHGTTRGCLLALDWIVKQRRRKLSVLPPPERGRVGVGVKVLDIGTGTGVLAIAAAKALRAPVLASDIDPEAVRIARENARLNGVSPLVACIEATGLADPQFRARGPFDLVLANILLAPLTRLASPMRGLLAPRARVVLSGLLATQERAALAAYTPHGLTLTHRIPLGEWVTLVLTRQG
jgi:ribosomal protein L11 methyltransferase